MARLSWGWGGTTGRGLALGLPYKALQGDKGNIGHSLQTLERHGLLIIGRSPGGHAESLFLTPAGHQRAAQLPGSGD